MPKFLIPAVWQMSGTLTIEAATLADAKDIAINAAGLPVMANYLDDSFEIDTDHPDFGQVVDA